MINKGVEKRKEKVSAWMQLWRGVKVIGIIGGAILLIGGVIFLSMCMGAAVARMQEAEQNIPEPVTLLREGTVEDIQFFQHGALNESRTFINFTDARSLLIGGYQPFEEGVRYRIWYKEWPYQYDGEVPTDAHVTLMQYEEA